MSFVLDRVTLQHDHTVSEPREGVLVPQETEVEVMSEAFVRK